APSAVAPVTESCIFELLHAESCIRRISVVRPSVEHMNPSLQAAAAPAARLRHGDPGMRRVRLGLFAPGLAPFALLYTPQPLLPLLSTAFHASPAAASLAMSA